MINTARALRSLVLNKPLNYEDIDELIEQIIQRNIPGEQLAGVLSILASRGEKSEDVAAFAKSMRSRMISVHGLRDAVDLCGTGGDGHNTFNISTASMFVVAGVKQAVAKHGNRAASGSCGSADVLEALGVNINYDVQAAVDSGETLIFMYAPGYHPATKNIVPVRKALGIPTVFNMLGPLLNPAHVNFQIIGTTSEYKAELMAESIAKLPHKKVGVVCNDDGLDELTTTCANVVYEVDQGTVSRVVLDPIDYDIPRAGLGDLKGGSAQDNAKILQDILDGQQGPTRDIVVLNAGYCLYTAGHASDVASGIILARKSIDSGSAKAELHNFITSTNTAYARKAI